MRQNETGYNYKLVPNASLKEAILNLTGEQVVMDEFHKPYAYLDIKKVISELDPETPNRPFSLGDEDTVSRVEYDKQPVIQPKLSAIEENLISAAEDKLAGPGKSLRALGTLLGG